MSDALSDERMQKRIALGARVLDAIAQDWFVRVNPAEISEDSASLCLLTQASKAYTDSAAYSKAITWFENSVLMLGDKKRAELRIASVHERSLVHSLGFEEVHSDYATECWRAEIRSRLEAKEALEASNNVNTDTTTYITLKPVGVEKDPDRVLRATKAFETAQVEAGNTLLQLWRRIKDDGLINNRLADVLEDLEVESRAEALAAAQEEFIRSIAGAPTLAKNSEK